MWILPAAFALVAVVLILRHVRGRADRQRQRETAGGTWTGLDHTRHEAETRDAKAEADTRPGGGSRDAGGDDDRRDTGGDRGGGDGGSDSGGSDGGGGDGGGGGD